MRIPIPCILALLVIPLSAASMAADSVTVTIDGYAFQPRQSTIRPGDTVQWRNDEKRTSHEVVFPDGTASERLLPGDTYQRTFPEAGRYPYVCEMHKNHPAMAGEIVVEP